VSPSRNLPFVVVSAAFDWNLWTDFEFPPNIDRRVPLKTGSEGWVIIIIWHDVAVHIASVGGCHFGFRSAGRVRKTTNMDGNVVRGIQLHGLQADYFHLGSRNPRFWKHGKLAALQPKHRC